MSAHRHTKRFHRRLRHISRKSARAVQKTFTKTFVTLGDLISAAYEVGGSTDAAEALLSPISPLSQLLDRRIVVAH